MPRALAAADITDACGKCKHSAPHPFHGFILKRVGDQLKLSENPLYPEQPVPRAKARTSSGLGPGVHGLTTRLEPDWRASPRFFTRSR